MCTKTPLCTSGKRVLCGAVRHGVLALSVAINLAVATLSASAQEFYVDDYYEDGVTLWRRDTWFQDDHGRNIHLRTTWYYRSGQKLEEGGYLENLREGAWQTWFETGQLATESHYSASSLQGTYTAWHENGNTATQGVYSANMREGQWSAYHANTVLAERGSYHLGQRTGVWTSWSETGGKSLEGAYVNGIEDGLWQAWYRTGVPYEEGFKWMDLEYDEGVLLKKTVYWYNDYEEEPPGTLAAKEELTYVNGDEVNHTTRYLGAGWGQWAGHVWKEENYKNGLQHGWFREYNMFQPTELMDEQRYENGVLRDAYWYYDNGKKKEERHYNAAGLIHGFYGKWFDTGAPEMLGTYISGSAQGYWQRWMHGGWTDAGGKWATSEGYDAGIMSGVYQVGVWYGWSHTVQWDYNLNRYVADFDSGYYDYGPGYNPPPPYTPPEPEKREIRGLVTEPESGTGIAGATVTGGGVTATTDSQGFYLMEFSEGNYSAPITLTASREGFLTARESVDLSSLQFTTVNFALNYRAALAQPAITSVRSGYGTFFVEGVTVQNPYTVAVNWNGATPGTLLVNVNGAESSWPATADGGTFTLDMGHDLIPSTDVNRNTLFVKARSSDGVESPLVRLRPVCAPSPGWLSPMSWAFTFMASASDGAPAYTLTGAWPQPPIEEAKLSDALPAWLWDRWKTFPYVGGEYELKKTQLSLITKYKTDNTGSVTLGGQGGFKIADKALLAKIRGTAKLSNQHGRGLEWQTSEVNLGVEGRVEQELGLVHLCPPIIGVYQVPVIGRFLLRWTGNAKAKASFGVFGGSTFGIATTNGFPWVSKCNPEFGCNGTLALNADICGAETEVSGNGSVKVVGQLFPSARFDKVEAELWAKLAFVIRGFRRDFDIRHTFAYPFPGDPAPQLTLALGEEADAQPLAFEPIGRDFLNRTGYSRFVAADGGKSLLSTTPAGRSLSGPAEAGVRLVDSVFPYAQPALAVQPYGWTAIAYVYFDPGDATVQATEIAVILFDGFTYTNLGPALNDTRAEYSPTVAFDSNGKLVAVWERVKDEDFTGSTLEEMMPRLEIVTATLDPTYATWTDPVPLTDNEHADFSPMLTRGPDGNLFLAWQSNVSNELVGATNAPSVLHSARWNAAAGAFEAVTNAPAALADVVGMDLAFDGAEALLVYSRDVDGDPATTNDVELFQMRENAGAWNMPTRLTDNSVPDLNPRVAYRAAGAPELLWLQDTNMVRLTDWNSGASEVIRVAGGSFTLANFRMACDAQGRVVVTWQDADGEGPDLFYSVYDPAHHVWSEDLRLTRDPLLEKAATSALGPDGALHVAYEKKDMTNDVTHLYHLSYLLQTDLAAGEGDLALTPAIPNTNEAVTLTCTVKNAGDLAVADAQAAFYLGDPNAGGVLLGTAPVSPPVLRAGDEGTASLAWVTPSAQEPGTLFAVVDAAGAVAEQNENNNTAQLALFQPDLLLASVRYEERADGQVDLIARVANAGTVDAPAFTVGFKVNGYEMGAVEMPGLRPGTEADVTHLVWAQISFSNRPSEVVAVADSLNVVPESNESNNTDYVGVVLRADSDGDGMPDQWEMARFRDLSHDSESDTDGDGALDKQEYLAGTDPSDSDSVMTCDIGTPDSQGRISVTLAMEPGQTYQMQYCDDLAQGVWHDLGAPVTATFGMLHGAQLDQQAAGVRQRFYRVRILTTP